MKSLKIVRTKETFMEKMKTSDPKTMEGYVHTLQNFENYCMEKTGKVDCVDDLKELEENDLFEFLLDKRILFHILRSRLNAKFSHMDLYDYCNAMICNYFIENIHEENKT